MIPTNKSSAEGWESELWVRVGYCEDKDGEIDVEVWKNSVISFVQSLLTTARCCHCHPHDDCPLHTNPKKV